MAWKGLDSRKAQPLPTSKLEMHSMESAALLPLFLRLPRLPGLYLAQGPQVRTKSARAVREMQER